MFTIKPEAPSLRPETPRGDFAPRPFLLHTLADIALMSGSVGSRARADGTLVRRYWTEYRHLGAPGDSVDTGRAIGQANVLAPDISAGSEWTAPSEKPGPT